MLQKLIFKPFDFEDNESRFYTNILMGEIGGGKTSFIVKYLYLFIQNSKINGIPFKTVFVSIDGFEFDAFNKLAKSQGLDIEFKWLDLDHFKRFAYAERDLFTQFNSDGQGIIAKRVVEYIDDEYKKYISALIICDEADHYLTKKDDEFANFLKFKRHYSIEIWFLTQKFQNLHDCYYNSGAINRFLRIRSSMFNLGKTRIVQLWANSNTAKADNLITSNSFEIEDKIYTLYDSGAVLKTGSGAKNKLKLYILLFFAAIIFSVFIFYTLLGDYIVDSSSDKEQIINQIENTNLSKETKLETIDMFNQHIVKCVTFSYTSNCYFKNNFSSHSINYITKLASENYTNIQIIFSYKKMTYLSVDDIGLKFIFDSIKKGEKDKNEN